MTKLYFCQYNRRYALGMVGAYSAGLSKRVLPAFNEIEAEADAAVEMYFNERINEPVEYDDPDDFNWEYHEERVYEAAKGHAESVYLDLEFVRRQITGLAVAGLYHLWERLLKEFLVREGLREKRWTHRAKFKQLITLLSDNGWDVLAQDFYRDLERLRLVANTVKHSDGDCCGELLVAAPELFFDWGVPLLNERRGADDLRLDVGHFEQFTQGVRAFFEQFPERLPE
jgi:hypothetical protein